MLTLDSEPANFPVKGFPSRHSWAAPDTGSHGEYLERRVFAFPFRPSEVNVFLPGV